MSHPIGEIKVHFYSEGIVEGAGRCPMCDKIVAGRLDMRQLKPRGVMYSDEKMFATFVDYATKRHKARCQAQIVITYDGRFDNMIHNPLKPGHVMFPDYVRDSDIDMSSV